MKRNWNVILIWIIYLMIWVDVSIVILYTIYITHRITPLWFFLIPACLNIRSQVSQDSQDL